jgi:hypothetical protein
MSINRKMNRLRTLVFAVAALGASSATMSGALTAFALQNPPAAATSVA